MPAKVLHKKPRKASKGLTEIVIGNQVRIPAWVGDLPSFRRWACSHKSPERGWFSFLNGELWVDVDMEELLTHNQVKGEYAIVLSMILRERSLGRYFRDRARLTHPAAGLSTEPDGLFAFWETLRSGSLKMVPGAKGGFVELEGTADMALEVVSANSVHKDTVVLADLYWRAGVSEYWLVDARSAVPHFTIFRHMARGYVAVKKQGGWLKSEVFGKAFRLNKETDPLGHPLYVLATQS